MQVKKPTIRDVAKVSGVSPMTVSHVLNDRSEKVGAQTRERVMRVIQELHYSPSAIARGLTKRRLDAIGVVFYTRTPSSLVARPYHGDILGGILEATTQRDQSTTLFTEVGFTNNHKKIGLYCDGRCDGLIFVAPPTVPELIEAMRHRSVPFVIIGAPAEGCEWSYVDVDNVKASRAAVDFLIANGHRKIALLKGNPLLTSARLREEGYRFALSTAGIELDPTLVVPGQYSPESGYERTKALLARREGAPTALFCTSDDIAFGALDALSDMGLKVPEDVSVIGFDDAAASATCKPPLTTMRQPLVKLGAIAVDMLLDQLQEGIAAGSGQILEADLVVRHSVGPVRTAA